MYNGADYKFLLIGKQALVKAVAESGIDKKKAREAVHKAEANNLLKEAQKGCNRAQGYKVSNKLLAGYCAFDSSDNSPATKQCQKKRKVMHHSC